jgi:hypothetical protein
LSSATFPSAIDPLCGHFHLLPSYQSRRRAGTRHLRLLQPPPPAKAAAFPLKRRGHIRRRSTSWSLNPATAKALSIDIPLKPFAVADEIID